MTRPRTLQEVARRAEAGEQAFDPCLREFIDSFYSHQSERAQAIANRPMPLDCIKDAYLAATAEHLARRNGLDVPSWTDFHGDQLQTPFFSGGLEGLKAILTVQSPTAFRRRLLFISHDALDRPSRSYDGSCAAED